MFIQTDYFKWESSFKSNIVKNDSSLLTKKAYKPSVSSFQLLYSVHSLQCFQWLSTYIDCNVLNDIVFVITTMFKQTDYFKWESSFKSNIVKNDSSLYEESL